MKKKSFSFNFIVLVAVVAVLVTIFSSPSRSKQNGSSDANDEVTLKKVSKKVPRKSSSFSKKAPNSEDQKSTSRPAKETFKAVTVKEKSLLKLTKKMSKFSSEFFNKEELYESLKLDQLKIVSAYKKNPADTQMTFVRTRNSLPGTRYFHAQIAEAKEGSFIQHMSFEFEKGPDAFEKAKEAVESEFSDLNLEERTGSYILWKTHENYIVWIKALEKEDLNDDPYNAYEEADIGTIRVVVEMEIH